MFGLSKTGNRFLIGSLVVFILVAAVLLIVTVRFFSIANSNQMAGREFGKGRDAQACVDEAVRRHTVTIDPIMHRAESAFVKGCLIMAHTNADFCRGVPEFSVLNQSQSAAWAESKCREKGFTDAGCTQIYLTLVPYCGVQRLKESRSN